MANVVPLVVSGEIEVTQKSILMTVINQFPYYLVHDANGIPYFQPLYSDPSSGLDTFKAASSRITMASKPSPVGETAMTITTAETGSTALMFRVDPSLGFVVAPAPDTSVLPSNLEISPFNFVKTDKAGSPVVACGLEYVLINGISFYSTPNWSSSPLSQSVGSLQTAPVNHFYIFPVNGVVDENGNAVSDDSAVFDAIYKDAIGQGPTVFLFSSLDYRNIGGGKPYQISPIGYCGGNFYGTCSTNWNCVAQESTGFVCSPVISPVCILKALAIPVAVAIISFILLIWLYHRYATRINTEPATPATTRAMKITLAGLVIVPVLLALFIMLIIILGPKLMTNYMKTMCSL